MLSGNPKTIWVLQLHLKNEKKKKPENKPDLILKLFLLLLVFFPPHTSCVCLPPLGVFLQQNTYAVLQMSLAS